MHDRPETNVYLSMCKGMNVKSLFRARINKIHCGRAADSVGGLWMKPVDGIHRNYKIKEKYYFLSLTPVYLLIL